MSELHDIAKTARDASYIMASLGSDVKNKALANVASCLKASKDEIFAANKIDLEEAEKANLETPLIKRLKFNEDKLYDVVSGIESLIDLNDPVGKITLRTTLDDGLELTRVTCPIGVIGVIFESRPDALVQIASLCIKSGNAVFLKGGSEAINTNKALASVISKAGIDAGLPEGWLNLLTLRSEIADMLKLDEYIDLIIPRGSNAFVQYIMQNTNIAVLGHADGVCHTYIDADADPSTALKVAIDAKTQYVSACNAAETLLLHKDIADVVLERLKHASGQHVDYIPAQSEEDFREYLDYKMTTKIVNDEDEAIAHINRYGSHHTDCIITEDEAAAERFHTLVDSAGVYWNASTRFADGFRYGFGAEVGISTGKLPPRGPVGLDGLVTYKYRLKGNGQIVGDYASGKKAFHFVDLA